ncbi:unnamed protein product [Parajaminaea phylloscopi]
MQAAAPLVSDKPANIEWQSDVPNLAIDARLEMLSRAAGPSARRVAADGGGSRGRLRSSEQPPPTLALPTSAQLTRPQPLPPATYRVEQLSHTALQNRRAIIRPYAEQSFATFRILLGQMREEWLRKPSFLPDNPAARPEVPSNEVRIHMIKTKKRIDTRAVLRNRAARKVLEALKWSIQRLDLGKGLTVRDGAVLVVMPTHAALDAPMSTLISESVTGLNKIRSSGKKRLQPLAPLEGHSSHAPAFNSRHSTGRPREVTQHGRRSYSTNARGTAEMPPGHQYVLLSSVPSSLIRGDVIRLAQQSQGPVPYAERFAQDPSTPRPPIQYIVDIHQVYKSLTLRSSGAFVIETAKDSNAVKVAEHLNGKVVAGKSVKARPIENSQARRLLRTGLTSCSGKSYSRGLFGSVTDFLRSLVRHSPGRVAVLRGLPAGVSVTLLRRRLATRYALEQPNARGAALRVYDRVAKQYRGVKVEPIIKVFSEGGSADEKTSGLSPLPWRKGGFVAGADANRIADPFDDKDSDSVWTLDEDGSSDGSDPGVTSMFVIRFQTTSDAYRFQRRFNGQRWGLTPKSAVFGGDRHEEQPAQSRITPTGRSLELGVQDDASDGIDDSHRFAEGDGDDGDIDFFADDDSPIDTASHSVRGARQQRRRSQVPQARNGELVTPKRRYIAEVDILH